MGGREVKIRFLFLLLEASTGLAVTVGANNGVSLVLSTPVLVGGGRNTSREHGASQNSGCVLGVGGILGVDVVVCVDEDAVADSVTSLEATLDSVGQLVGNVGRVLSGGTDYLAVVHSTVGGGGVVGVLYLIGQGTDGTSGGGRGSGSWWHGARLVSGRPADRSVPGVPPCALGFVATVPVRNCVPKSRGGLESNARPSTGLRPSNPWDTAGSVVGLLAGGSAEEGDAGPGEGAFVEGLGDGAGGRSEGGSDQADDSD